MENGLRAFHVNETDWRDTATLGIMDEKPWHRLAAVALVAGRSNLDVAKAMGVEPQYISALRAQRWFTEMMALLVEERKAGLFGLLQGAAVDALENVISIANTSENEKVKLAANMYIVDQAHGKAVQKVVGVHATTKYNSPQEEHEALQKELAELRRQFPTNCAAGAEGLQPSLPSSSPESLLPEGEALAVLPTDTVTCNGGTEDVERTTNPEAQPPESILETQ